VPSKKKKSLGRDLFDAPVDKDSSSALRKLIKGKAVGAGSKPREVEVRVKLTPSNIKKLDDLRKKLSLEGKGDFSRNELIRIAITLLSPEDF
jgi:hypothetical protein